MAYKGYLVENVNGSFVGNIKEIDTPEITDGKVLIKVKYSSLNYKDALASSGAKGVVRSYPFVPGIDVAGEIIETRSSKFSIGDEVIATGYKIGMSEFGGFGEIVHLPDNWVIKLPKNFSLYDAMIYGRTAVVTDVGGNAEIINDHNGFVAEAQSVNSFGSAMERMWSKRGELKALGEKFRVDALGSLDLTPETTIVNSIIEI